MNFVRRETGTDKHVFRWHDLFVPITAHQCADWPLLHAGSLLGPLSYGTRAILPVSICCTNFSTQAADASSLSSISGGSFCKFASQSWKFLKTCSKVAEENISPTVVKDFSLAQEIISEGPSRGSPRAVERVSCRICPTTAIAAKPQLKQTVMPHEQISVFENCETSTRELYVFRFMITKGCKGSVFVDNCPSFGAL